MNKIKLDKYKTRYGWKGKKYSDLIARIIAHNTEKISRAIGRTTQDKLRNSAFKLRTGRRMVIPDLEEVIPKRSVFLKKAAEKGKLMTDTIRRRLESDMREVMKIKGETGEQRFVTRRGKYAGRVSMPMVRELEKRFKETFDNYTKENKKAKTPSQIRMIAEFELRSTVNEIKFVYANRVSEKNNNLAMMKKWVHNPHLSKSPKYWREAHVKLDGKMIKLEEPFVYHVNGKEHRLMHPHDPKADPDQIIGCHCDYDIVMINRIKRT